MLSNKHISTRPKAILFDWDNTLADTWPIIHHALRETFIFMGREPWSMEETKENVHRSLRDSFPELFGDRWQEAKDKYMENFLSVHLERLTILPGAEDVLKLIKSRGIFMAVVSNKTGKHLREEVKHLGWGHYFGAVIGATDAPKGKPASEPVFMALAAGGILPSKDVWLVGDSITDVECAVNSAISPLFFGPRSLPSSSPVACPHVRDHAELLNFIKGV